MTAEAMPRGFVALMLAQFLSALADNALLIVAIALLQQQGLPGWWALLLKFSFTLSYVLLAPVVSEKSTMVGEKQNQFVFRVARDATKPEIKAAVELMFSTKDNKIEVVSVQVSNVLGKEKRFGRFMGRRKDWKKAYVRLKAGQEINFVAGEAK